MAKGSNDLNLLLKAQVIKIRAELDITKSMTTIRKQVKEISDKLDKENKRVKLKAELDISMKNLNQQFKVIQAKINSSKSFKPIRIGLEIDTKGSAENIKKQLREMYKTIDDFNRKYGQQMKQMQQRVQQSNLSSQSALKNGASVNVPDNATVGGFNYKLFTQQVKDAERLMRDTFGKKGNFASFETRDAQGNLKGFVAQLEKANGVVYKTKYQWDSISKSFTPISSQTVDTIQKNVRKAQSALNMLYSDIDKLQNGKGKQDLFSHYNNLQTRGNQNTLNQYDVKDMQRRIKEEQVLQQQIKAENNDLMAQKKLIQEIRSAMNRDFNKTGDVARKDEYKKLLNDVKNANGSLKEQKQILNEITQVNSRRNDDEKTQQANAKKKLQTLRQIRAIESKVSSSDVTSRTTLGELKYLAQKAKTGKEWNAIQERMIALQTRADDSTLKRKSLELQEKLNRKIKEYADLTGRSNQKLQRDLAQVSVVASRGFKDLEAMYASFNRKVSNAKSDINRSLSQGKDLFQNNSNSQLKTDITSAVNSRDITALQQYIGQLKNGRVETIQMTQTKDALGRSVDRLNVKMAGAGKTVKTYVIDLDRANGQLRQMAQGIDYNANRNLGVIEQLKVAMARIPVWMVGMTAFYGAIRSVRNTVEEILKVDKALTELRRVVSDSINIDQVYDNVVNMSKDLGNNIHDIMQTMNDFARTFGEFNERQLTAITNTATLMSNVSELTATEAGNTLVGTMNAFNIEAEESIRIVDAMNEVDNNFAVSTKQLAEGMSKGASTAKTFGVSMEESIGHITAISSVTMESGKIIGNSLKTIYSRITTMSEAEDVLNGVNISIKDMGGNVKPVQTILSELGGKWTELTDEERQNIAVKIAGRYQLSRFLAMMNNWQTAVDATATALTSEGSAMKENAKYLESFEARINKLKNTFTELALAIGESSLGGMMLGVIEGLAGIATGATKMVDAFGALPLAMGGIVALLTTLKVFKLNIFDTARSVGSFGETLRIQNIQFQQGRDGVRGYSGALAGMRSVISYNEGAINRLTGAVKSFGVTLASSLVFGLIFAGIGLAVEALIKKWQEAKKIAEETEKANKKLIDSYRNTEGGLDNLVKKHEELKKAVTDSNGNVVEGTEKWNEYLEVNQQLAKQLPTMVKYTDSNGVAHLQTAEAMQKEVEIARKLSEQYAILQTQEYEGKQKKEIKNISEYADKMVKANEKINKIEKNGLSYGGIAESPEKVNIEIQKLKIEALNASQDIQESVQKISLNIRDVALASLEAGHHLDRMSESQIKLVEDVAQQNEHHLRKLAEGINEHTTESQKEKILAEINQKQEELKDIAVVVGEKLDTKLQGIVTDATKGVTDGFEKDKITEKVKSDFDNLLKILPKSFMNLESISASGASKFYENFDKYLSISDKVADGNQNFDGLSKQIQSLGFSADEAGSIVYKLGIQYGNAEIRAKYLQSRQEGLIESTEEMIDVMSDAIDVSEKLFGTTDSELSGLQTRIELIKTLKETGNYDGNLQAQQAIADLELFIGKGEKQILGSIDKYYTLFKEMGDFSPSFDKNGDMEKEAREKFAKIEKLAKELDYELDFNSTTGKLAVEETNKVTESTKKNTEEKKKNKEETIKQKDAVDILNQSYSTLKDNMNQESKATYFQTVSNQLQDLNDKVLVTKDETGKLIFTMSDGSDSAYLTNLNKQLGDLGVNIALSKDDADGIKLLFNDGTGSTVIQNIGKDVENASVKISNLVKDADYMKDNFNILPNNYSQIDFTTLSDGIVSTTGKVQLLSDTLGKTFENTKQTVISVEEFVNKAENIANTIDTIINNTSSLSLVKQEVDKLAESLLVAQEKLGSIFNGVNLTDKSIQTIANARKSIEDLAISSTKSKESVENLGRTLVGLGQLTVGGLSEYVRQLGLLSLSLNASANNSRLVLQSQISLAQTFSNVVSIIKSYNVTISNAGVNVDSSYQTMANSIISYTSIMMTQYQRHSNGVKDMVDSSNKHMDRMNSNFSKNSKEIVLTINTMSSRMYQEFKNGMDKIVVLSSGVPARIGKAIRDNMSSASSAMDAVAKDMVSRFKKELGIHSPSRVFEDLGYWTIKGLANGLTGTDLKSLGTSVFEDFGGGVFNSLDMIKAYVSGDFSKIAGQAGAGVQQWAGVATKALQMTGQYSPENLQRLLYQMQTESSGNAMAINLWDSNAKRGTPSKGLMQVIDPTFKAYAMSGYNSNIYDPLSNIIASIRYAVSRYGSLAKAYRGVGYANGGFVDKMELAWHGEEGEEAIIPLIKKRRKRGLDLFMETGKKLGLNMDVFEMFNRISSGGIASNSQASAFGMSSGEGSSDSSGGGDSGSSGIMRQSVYVGSYDFNGNYDFETLATKSSKSNNNSSSTETLAPLYKDNKLEKQTEAIALKIQLLETKMSGLTEGTLKYRNELKKLIKYQNDYMKSLNKERDALEKRQKAIRKQLNSSGLKDTKNHTAKQRETYNSLMEELNSNQSKINSIRTEVASLVIDTRQKSKQIFEDFINEVVSKFDKAISKIQDRIDNIDFELEVLEYLEPENETARMDLLTTKAKEEQKKQATAESKYSEVEWQSGKNTNAGKEAKTEYDAIIAERKRIDDMRKKQVSDAKKEYNATVKKYGADSNRAKKAKQEYDKAIASAKRSGDISDKAVEDAKKEYRKAVRGAGAKTDVAKEAKKEVQSATLATLSAEKAIKDERAKVADAGIEALKKYYETMKKMGTDAIDLEIKSLEEAHKKKMKLYDDEIKKINKVYDAKIKEIDDEVSQETYNEELAERVKSVSDLRNQVDSLKRDTSLEGRKKYEEARLELEQAEKDLAKFQKDHKIETTKKALEEERQELIGNIENKKEIAETELEERKIALEKEKEELIKYYDDIINNEAEWARKRTEFINGNFKDLNNELQAMSVNIDEMAKGNFDSVTKSFNSFSDGVKEEFKKLNELELSNLKFNVLDAMNDVEEILKAKGFTFSNGKVSVNLASNVTTPSQTSNSSSSSSSSSKSSNSSSSSSSSSGSKTSSSSTSNDGNRKTTTSLNMRSKPAYGNNVIQVLKAGTVVEYIGIESGWAKIKHDKKTGYVGKDYLKKFDTGGYTGNNVPREGALAILHNKELVLNDNQTQNILDVAKIFDGVMNSISSIRRNSMFNGYYKHDVNGNQGIINNYDLTMEIENLSGTKENANTLIKETMKGLRKMGGS